MVAIYYAKCEQYEVTECSSGDIEEHYKVVESIVSDMSTEQYKGYMQVAVDQNSAYKVMNAGICLGFLYLRKEKNTHYGVSMYMAGNVYAACMLMKEMFEHVKARKVLFLPHSNQLLYLRSIVDGVSIRLWHNNGGYLTVKLEDASDKIRRIYEMLEIHQ